jgi:carbonic anhydrase
MRTHIRWSFTLVPVALLAVAGCASSTEHASHWSYQGESGPSNWGAMNPEWSMAHDGRAQSPINLSQSNSVKADLAPLRFTAGRTVITPKDNGHTIQWDCEGMNTMTVGNEVYALKQFHFHAPSEHTVDGQHYPVELHFVHANAKGNLAVLGVMLTESNSVNEIYQMLAATIPQDAGEQYGHDSDHAASMGGQTIFSPYSLLPSARRYATYQGSLTTPPCTEGVRWIVLTSPARVSSEQVATFTETYFGNARPVQPVNGRLVLVND